MVVGNKPTDTHNTHTHKINKKYAYLRTIMSSSSIRRTFQVKIKTVKFTNSVEPCKKKEILLVSKI